MPEERNELYERLLEEKASGDANKLARKLLNLNLGAKEENDALKTEVADLKAKLTVAESKSPPADHVTLPKSDADALATYRALGKPEEIRTALDRLPTLEGQIKARARKDQLADVAKAAGLDPDVFATLVPEGMTFEPAKVRDERGREVETFAVKDKGPDGADRERTIDDLLESDWKKFAPALRPAGNADQPQDPRTLPTGLGGYRGTAPRLRVRDDGDDRPDRLTAEQRDYAALAGAGLNGL